LGAAAVDWLTWPRDGALLRHYGPRKTGRPAAAVERLANIVREAILPTVELLIPLRSQARLVTGGYLVGESTMVFVFEADSEEEVREVLEDLPPSELATTKVRRMRSLEEIDTFDK
jgi:hypothetical protein